MSEIKRIPIDAVEVESAHFKRRPTGSVDDLAASIKSIGLLSPVIVRTAGPRRYDLVAGAHRLAACRQLGNKFICRRTRLVAGSTTLYVAQDWTPSQTPRLARRGCVRVHATAIATLWTRTRDVPALGVFHRHRACTASVTWSPCVVYAHTIDARVMSMSDLEAELAMLHENLVRCELTVMERGEAFLRCQEIHEALYPQTKHGGAPGTAGGGKKAKEGIMPSFAKVTAAKAKVSPWTVRREVQIAKNLTPEVKETVRGTALADRKVDLIDLARLKPNEQAPVVERVLNGSAKTVREASRIIARESRRREAENLPAPVISGNVRLEVADAVKLPLGDESVFCVITSPPYGLGVDYEFPDVPASEWPQFMLRWLSEAYRVAQAGGRLALNVPLNTSDPRPRPTYAQAVEAALTAGWVHRFDIVWNEDNISKGTAWGSVFAPHVIARAEMVPVFYKPVDGARDGGWRRHGQADLTLDELMELHDGLWNFRGESRPETITSPRSRCATARAARGSSSWWPTPASPAWSPMTNPTTRSGAWRPRRAIPSDSSRENYPSPGPSPIDNG